MLTLSVNAGNSTWPRVKYSYAMVYLYNVDGNLKGMHEIIKDDQLNKTVEGEGKKLSTEQLGKLEAIFSAGAPIDELVIGLSGCYIPRHAIVYYDEKDKPVASMSICFECEGIRFYTPSYPRNAYASTEKTVRQAQEKLALMKEIVASLGFKTDFKYIEFRKEENLGSMFFTDNSIIDSLFPEKITFANHGDLCFSDSFSLKGITVDTKEKYTNGGTKYTFQTVRNGNSHLLFSGRGENTTLESAKITDNIIFVCKKVKIGMKLEEVQALLPVYDGIAYPEFMEITNDEKTKTIKFHFKDSLLDYYEVEVRVW
jgi:hypothetical protein